MICIIILIIAILGNSIQIYIDYISMVKIPDMYSNIYLLFKNYNHVWLGSSLFLLMKALFDRMRIRNNYVIKFLDLSDEYSYQVFLVHQFIILGPFSLMSLTGSKFVNIFIILVLIVFMSFCLKHIEMLIVKSLKKRKYNK